MFQDSVMFFRLSLWYCDDLVVFALSTTEDVDGRPSDVVMNSALMELRKARAERRGSGFNGSGFLCSVGRDR